MKIGPWQVRDPLNATLAGMPELELFPDDETRERSLRELSNEPGDSKAFWGWIVVAVIVMVIVAVAAQWLLFSLLAWPLALAIPAFIVVLVAMITVSMRAMHGRILERGLREKVLAAGVPLCLKCGYGLGGHGPNAERCAECGAAIEERARALMTPSDERSRVT